LLFFHPALVDEPIIFVEVALADGLTGDLERLLDLKAPVLTPDKVNTESSIPSTTAWMACEAFLRQLSD